MLINNPESTGNMDIALIRGGGGGVVRGGATGGAGVGDTPRKDPDTVRPSHINRGENWLFLVLINKDQTLSLQLTIQMCLVRTHWLLSNWLSTRWTLYHWISIICRAVCPLTSSWWSAALTWHHLLRWTVYHGISIAGIVRCTLHHGINIAGIARWTL